MGIVIPLWVWLPVVLWVMWRYERRAKIRLLEGIGLEKREPVLLEAIEEERERIGGLIKERQKEIEMKGFWVVAVLGVIGALTWAWEPKTADPGVAAASAAGAVQVNPPGPIPPGMIYDPEHNSFHYPPPGTH